MQKLTIYYETKCRYLQLLFTNAGLLLNYTKYIIKKRVLEFRPKYTPPRVGENGTARPEHLPNSDIMTENVAFNTILTSHCPFKSNVTFKPIGKLVLGRNKVARKFHP